MPQILLTQHEDLFLQKLFETNIPQIKEKIIVVRDILRIPGVLSKIVVESKKLGFDPLGACIGENGERIKAISSLIYPERVDVAA
jgi:N utilization substance protein A